MANADMTKDQVPSVNVMEWRSKCADILMEKVILLLDSNLLFICMQWYI